MIQNHAGNLPVIEVLPLFPEMNKNLISLLKSLNEDEWAIPTVLPGRTVKDLASHILDTSLKRLSMCRDNYQSTPPSIKTYDDLVNYIQALNKAWIDATKRLSPDIIISLLEFSESQMYEYLKTLNPNDKAAFSVAWAGESESQNWFDIAREYTEKWHHQMQIRLAVNRPGINSREFFYPAIDTFMRGLPHGYRNTEAALGCGIEIHITGEGGGFWFLEKTETQWQLVKQLKKEPVTKIEMTDDIAWRLFMDSISPDIAVKSIVILGNRALGEVVLGTKTVMR
ncbi:MAG: maleylpyruvate isomerase N-terminal domain-containing protein [Candidatus Babeliales bacterium]